MTETDGGDGRAATPVDTLAVTRRWAAAFAAVTPGSYDGLLALAAPDIRFRDPFNDVTGQAALAAILTEMFESCIDPRFEILDVAAGARAGYVRWVFRFRPKTLGQGPEWRIEGMSEIHVGSDGSVVAHIDHWDSASGLLARLPVVGAGVRWLLARFRVKAAR
ncbi:nuclear transport factor 2 family protein [Marivibrio halodurans]|uniref:Nuclear transport factor 2 family protein n=1 Tax=Marivibrio halodurans TaxID=2039722 RepID=A0A8J7S262_9PROT|nr:nuclear transport factor 2 family protein [Marivibrio halodurans]MBP5857203.1 nuclear transport factor 2 family protein [Marivibrio halodurans]